jgi:hypothetical protein
MGAGQRAIGAFRVKAHGITFITLGAAHRVFKK